MYEDRMTERKTKFGIVAFGDLVMITTSSRDVVIAHIIAMYEGNKKNYIAFETFCPTTGVVGSKKMSWYDFEGGIVKYSFLDKLEVSKHHWQTFVGQYRNFLLIQKAERQWSYHVVAI